MAINSTALKRAGWAEAVSVTSLTVPAFALVAMLVLLPGLWLLWLSFQNKAGTASLSNYLAIVTDSLSLRIFGTTIGIALLTTSLCVVIGYPLAYFLVGLPKRIVGYCMIAVLLPLWTSVLVRTYAWMVLLQRRGLVNDLLIKLGAIDEPLRLANGTAGTIIGMVHVMLPYMVLPLFGSMRAISPDYVRAAASLGSSPARAFRLVFLPLTLPGLIAGSLMVFILCLGFYVTPALLGGGRVMMVSMQIDRSIELYADWGAGSAMGVVLLVSIGLLGVLARRFRRIGREPSIGGDFL